MENPNKQFNLSGMYCWQTGFVLKLEVLLHQNTRNSGGSATSCNGNIFQNRGSFSPSKREREKKKAQRKDFRALNKFSFSSLFLLWANIMLFHVYSLGVKKSSTKTLISEGKLEKQFNTKQEYPREENWTNMLLRLKSQNLGSQSWVFRLRKELAVENCKWENLIADFRKNRKVRKTVITSNLFSFKNQHVFRSTVRSFSTMPGLKASACRCTEGRLISDYMT